MERDQIRERIKELSEQEKTLWAQLNYVLGARSAFEQILDNSSPPALTLTSDEVTNA